MKKKPNFNRKERGQSLTELAISFMLVMLIFSGAVDFGRAYFVLVALRDAAQEGVLYGSVYPYDQTSIKDRVHQSSNTPVNMATTVVDITYGPASKGFAADGSDACAGFVDTKVDTDHMGPTDVYSNYINVDVSTEFSFTMPFITPIINSIYGSNTIWLHVNQTHTILSPGC